MANERRVKRVLWGVLAAISLSAALCLVIRPRAERDRYDPDAATTRMFHQVVAREGIYDPAKVIPPTTRPTTLPSR